MVITVKRKWVIALAWGPRRVTSNKRYGTTKAYPKYVSASFKTWVRWLVQGSWWWVIGKEKIITPPRRAKARARGNM